MAPPTGELRDQDRVDVERQIGREPTTTFTVVVRCAPSGTSDLHPLVIRNHPLDAEGNPFPTLYWLTCPEAVKAVSRVESGGAIGEMNERVDGDDEFDAELRAAHEEYAKERASGVPQAEGWGGVGGTRQGVKCLHAHYANHLAGGDDPVGAWVARQVEPIHGPACADRVAVIDQGTNSIRLLIADPATDGSRVELARDMVIVRLGEGVDESGRLSDAALMRTGETLGRYARRARAMRAMQFRFAATSAVRDASNRKDLADRVRHELGVEMEVLSGEREAGLSFLGATEGLTEPGPLCVFDIGGGSTELVMGSSGAAGGALRAISTQMGSVRLTERFGEDVEAMGAEIDRVLAEVEAAVPVRDAGTLIAVAGTPTTIQAIALGMPRYDPDRIHRTWLDLGMAEYVVDGFIRMSVAERAAIPVMARGRGDVILAGGQVLVRAMRRFGIERVLVSEEDILDGLAAELLASR